MSSAAPSTPAAASPPSAAGSLRERKKQQTKELLVASAYDVIRDRGIDALTAEAIAERAGVSRRTFFNYFPTLESAIEPVIAEFHADIGSKVAECDLGPTPMASLARVVRETTDLYLLERFTVIGLMALRSTTHKALLHTCASAWLETFVKVLRDRTGEVEGVDDLYLYGAATALIGAAEASLLVWLARTGGEITPTTIALRQELLAQSIERLGAGFDAGPVDAGTPVVPETAKG